MVGHFLNDEHSGTPDHERVASAPHLRKTNRRSEEEVYYATRPDR